MLSRLLRFGRRQLHTIVSKEIIKPSSPTPSHSKTYNLSLFDQIAVNSHSPIIAFYPNVDRSSHDKILQLKNSLSKTLTQYYPFAGKVEKTSPKYVECNDDGVEFIEASEDRSLSDFLQQSVHEDLDPLFPNDLMWFDPHIRGDTEGVISPLAVQVNRFACGGVAVASTLYHKVGDARSLLNFITHWAAVTAEKDTTPINPHIIRYPTKTLNLPELVSDKSRAGCITRSLVFPNQKLNELKAKVTEMSKEAGQPIVNPTRIEALSWLIHNRAMAAATTKNSGTFKPYGMVFPTDMRGMFAEKLPGTTMGNLILVMEFPTANQHDLQPHITIGEMRKQKKALQSIPNLETAIEVVSQTAPEKALETSKRIDPYYQYTSLSRFPAYDIDFGWGKPAKVTLGGTVKNVTIFIAAPDGNGIEALVCLEKEHMKIVQNDPELLAYC